jgi:hypothetical protein
MTTAQIQTAATLKVSCKSRTLGPVYTGLYRHDEDLESTVRLDSIRAFFSEDHLFHPIASPVDDHSSSGKTHRPTARRNQFGATQDAEWAWTDGKSRIVQSRDITSRISAVQKRLARALDQARDNPPDEVAFSQNELSEMLPQPTPAVPPEIGGWLSHRAIVAREYHVAMIVGTRGLSRVTDGSLL